MISSSKDAGLLSGTDDAANWPRSSNLLAPRWQWHQRCPGLPRQNLISDISDISVESSFMKFWNVRVFNVWKKFKAHLIFTRQIIWTLRQRKFDWFWHSSTLIGPYWGGIHHRSIWHLWASCQAPQPGAQDGFNRNWLVISIWTHMKRYEHMLNIYIYIYISI